MTTLAELKARRGKAELDRLREDLQKSESAGFEADPTYWKPTKDKTGKSSALIRFLPACPTEENFFVKYYDHFFKGPTGQHYVENSRTSLGKSEKDPVTDANAKIWQLGKKGENYIRTSNRIRRCNFVSNILVIEDSGNPENNGKVFKYKSGKKIYEKIDGKLFPKEGSFKEPLLVYDLWDGANFIIDIKMVKVKGADGTEQSYPNYDACEFASPSPVAKTDKEIDAIWQKTYPLMDLVDPAKYKPYDVLEKRLREVVGNTDEIFIRAHGGQLDSVMKEAAPRAGKTVSEPWNNEDDGEENDAAFFESLAKT